jgi:hypothetical protein
MHLDAEAVRELAVHQARASALQRHNPQFGK